MPKQAEGPGAAMRVLLKGDLHLHSDWSDGGSPIKTDGRDRARRSATSTWR